MNYYGSKPPDGMHYGGMPSVPRAPNPYSGKPDIMFGGHPGWNPMMMHQPYGVSKHPINNQFTGQVRKHATPKNNQFSPLFDYLFFFLD